MVIAKTIKKHSADWRKGTKGAVLDLAGPRGGVLATFRAGGKKRHNLGDGCVYVNGEVELANGIRAWAVLEIDEQSSGEHCGTLIFVPSKGKPPFARAADCRGRPGADLL